MRDGLDAVAVFNMADIASSDNTEAAAAMADFPALRYIDTPIRRRKSIANAAGKSLSVLEYQPRNEKAITELNALLKAIY